jgi:hypothetical protein
MAFPGTGRRDLHNGPFVCTGFVLSTIMPKSPIFENAVDSPEPILPVLSAGDGPGLIIAS